MWSRKAAFKASDTETLQKSLIQLCFPLNRVKEVKPKVKVIKHSSITTSLNFLETLSLTFGVCSESFKLSLTRGFSQSGQRAPLASTTLSFCIRRPLGHPHHRTKIHPLICCLVIIQFRRMSLLGQLPLTNMPPVILCLHLSCFTEATLRPRLRIRFAFCLCCFPVEQHGCWGWPSWEAWRKNF